MHQKMSNQNIFNILTLSLIFKFDEFLEYIAEKHFECIENNINLFSYLLLHADKFNLSDKFYVHSSIDYSTDNYKLISELISNNKIQAVKYIIENYPLENREQVLNDIIKFENLELLKIIHKFNVSQEKINISTINLDPNNFDFDFYYYLFFNFLEDKSIFQVQYYTFAFEQNNINLFEKILSQLNTGNKKIALKSFIRNIIEENKTRYLEIILKHREHFNLFDQQGNIVHICLSLRNVDCLKILFSYQECIEEFKNNVLNSKNEYGNFLNIANNLILLKNF